MNHEFPALPDVPLVPNDLIFAFDTEGRPRIWDEHGMPLDSYYSEEHGPSRLQEDYAHVDPAVEYEHRVVPDADGYGVNTGLMDYVRPHVPETLHLVLDAARAYRTALNVPEDGYLPTDQALTVVIGLNSLWALLMYRRNNRVANGELPSHVADAHRTIIGYEGAINTISDFLDDLGISPEAAAVPPETATQIAMAGMKSSRSHERCPASPRMIGEGMVALLVSPDQAYEQLLPTLSQCEDPRLLADLGIDDHTFAYFAVAMRQLMATQEPEDFDRVKQLLAAA
jgi:hypothetical protein